MARMQRLGLVITVLVTSLYVAAILLAPDSGVQLTSMVELDDPRLATYVQVTYTGVLVALSLSGILAVKGTRLGSLGVHSLAPIAIALTVLPVGYSLLYTFRPQFYELYWGEAATVGGALLLALGTPYRGRRTS